MVINIRSFVNRLKTDFFSVVGRDNNLFAKLLLLLLLFCSLQFYVKNVIYNKYLKLNTNYILYLFVDIYYEF